jgi:DNA-binding MarR family transcriptional regulator
MAGSRRQLRAHDLTEAGLALCHELDAVARAANDQLLAGFSDDEITQLTSMLRRLTRNVGEP